MWDTIKSIRTYLDVTVTGQVDGEKAGNGEKLQLTRSNAALSFGPVDLRGLVSSGIEGTEGVGFLVRRLVAFAGCLPREASSGLPVLLVALRVHVSDCPVVATLLSLVGTQPAPRLKLPLGRLVAELLPLELLVVLPDVALPVVGPLAIELATVAIVEVRPWPCDDMVVRASPSKSTWLLRLHELEALSILHGRPILLQIYTLVT